MLEQIAVAVVTGVGGGAAAWATLQGRVQRLEEMCQELKAEKASKESLSTLSASVERLTAEMDKRFDRLEALLRALAKGE